MCTHTNKQKHIETHVCVYYIGKDSYRHMFLRTGSLINKYYQIYTGLPGGQNLGTHIPFTALACVADTYVSKNVKVGKTGREYVRIANVNVNLYLCDCLSVCFSVHGNLFFYTLGRVHVPKIHPK